MKRLIFSLMLPVFFVGGIRAEEPVDTQAVRNAESVRMLVDARCAEDNTSSGKIVSCFLAFPDSIPAYFYEVNQKKKQIIINLLNTRIEGMVVDGKIDSSNVAGPVTSVLSVEEIRNKNETMKGLTAEWFPVVVVTLTLNPMISSENDVTITDIESAITLSVPWPDDKAKRDEHYIVDKKLISRPVLYSLIGAGTAGLTTGAYFIYRHIRYGDTGPEPLHPVLPVHPSEAP